MRKLLLLGLVAGAAVAGAAPAAADNCRGVAVIGTANSVALCDRRVWEYREFYLTCSLDTDLDGQAEAVCVPIVLLRIMG